MILFLPTPWLPRRRTCSPISSRSVAMSRINAVCCELLLEQPRSVATPRPNQKDALEVVVHERNVRRTSRVDAHVVEWDLVRLRLAVRVARGREDESSRRDLGRWVPLRKRKSVMSILDEGERGRT